MNKQSTRRTSKLVLGINTGLAWGVAFYALYTGQGAAVAGCLALIGGLYGSYVGIGHLDYRRLLACLTKEENDNYPEDNKHLGSRIGFWPEPDGDVMDEGREGNSASQISEPATHHQPVQDISGAPR